MVPWAIAILTLIPFYKLIFLYSRGLPQGSWTTYFHFSNGIFSMSWLWFLPVLFLFDLLYLLLWKLNLPTDKLPINLAVAAVFALALLHCALTIFKYFFNKHGRLGSTRGRLSYGVYIIHSGVMGLIALALLRIDLPGILKYPILTITTYAACNLIAYADAKTVKNLAATPG